MSEEPTDFQKVSAEIESKFIECDDWNNHELNRYVNEIPLETKELLLKWYIVAKWNQRLDERNGNH